MREEGRGGGGGGNGGAGEYTVNIIYDVSLSCVYNNRRASVRCNQ